MVLPENFPTWRTSIPSTPVNRPTATVSTARSTKPGEIDPLI